MKTKETIRNEMIRFAQIAWQIRETNKLHPFVHLMIEETCNEAFILTNKLEDTNYSVLEKLVKRLMPDTFNYIRPAHAILRIDPGKPSYILERETEFFVKSIPEGFEMNDFTALVFTPITDVKLSSVHIRRMFSGNTFYAVDNLGDREILFQKQAMLPSNTVYLGLQIGEEIQELKNLYFYLKFPHLNDNHEYYDLLSYLRWKFDGKELEVKTGFPVPGNTKPGSVESGILDFYHDHFLYIESPIRPDELRKQAIPDELKEIINDESAASFPPLYWLSIVFPSHFHSSDIEKMTVALNSFPVINRNYSQISFPASEITKLKETGIVDYLEQMLDIIREENYAFPQVDQEKMLEVYNAISVLENRDAHKIELNRLNNSAEVARIKINPEVEKVNGLPSKTLLMAHKNPELNKSSGILISPACGGRSFYDMESLKAINRFYMTSRDRILTQHHILSFCRMELGSYIEAVEVSKAVRISCKRNEGMVNVIEIRIIPRPEYVEYLKSSGALKDLHIRLKQRSPDTFRYWILLQ
jgi:hypothetical protein